LSLAQPICWQPGCDDLLTVTFVPVSNDNNFSGSKITFCLVLVVIFKFENDEQEISVHGESI